MVGTTGLLVLQQRGRKEGKPGGGEQRAGGRRPGAQSKAAAAPKIKAALVNQRQLNSRLREELAAARADQRRLQGARNGGDRVEALEAAATDRLRELASLERELAAARLTLATLQNTLTTMESSRSWRITRPLRRLRRLRARVTGGRG
jgi:hypothetical protein